MEGNTGHAIGKICETYGNQEGYVGVRSGSEIYDMVGFTDNGQIGNEESEADVSWSINGGLNGTDLITHSLIQ